MSDFGELQPEWDPRVVVVQIDNAAEVAATNAGVLEDVADQIQQTDNVVGQAAEVLTEADVDLQDSATTVEEKVTEQTDRVNAYFSDSDSDSSSDSGGSDAPSGGGGGPSFADLRDGFSSFLGWVTGVFSSAEEQAGAVERATEQADRAATDCQETLAERSADLVGAPVVGRTEVGPSLDELQSSLEALPSLLDDVRDSEKDSVDVRQLRAEITAKIADVQAFKGQVDKLTADFAKPTLVEGLTLVADGAEAMQKVRAAIERTKVKHWVPTGEWSRRVRDMADEIRTRTQRNVEEELEANRRSLLDKMRDNVVTSPDGYDHIDNQNGALIVGALESVVTEWMAEVAVKNLEKVGEQDLVDVVLYGAKNLGGPATRKAVEAVEKSIEAADIVIGTATTAAELLGQVKDWSTADAHKTALSVNTDLLNELGRVTAPDGREITKLVIDELKNKGEQERDTVLEHVKNYSRSVAKSATQVREKTLAARQKTREDVEVAKAAEITEECAALKRRTYQVFGEKAPQRVLVDDTAEGGDYHFEEKG